MKFVRAAKLNRASEYEVTRQRLLRRAMGHLLDAFTATANYSTNEADESQ